MLLRGEHVIIPPDIEETGKGSSRGARLTELVGADRNVAAEGGHGGRGKHSRENRSRPSRKECE
jgi:hypothetical protein